MRRFFSSRAFQQGSAATAITILFIAVVVAFNLFVGALADRHQWRLDLTVDQAFVLTDESRQFLAEMDTDVTIYVLMPETTLTASGDYFIQANEVIRQYAALSPHITVRYIDLTRDPAFAARFPQFQLNSQTILLVTGGRAETLSIFDLFNIETDFFGGGRIVSSRAEQTLTSMLLFLTMDHQVTVAVLTGSGVADSSGLVELLETNRYRVIYQNPLTEDIAPEVSLIIMNAPTRDLPEDAIARLERFLQRDDKDVSLLYFAGVNQPPLPNIEAFLADRGILIMPGIIYQSDLNMTWGGPFLSAVHYLEDFYARHALDFFSIMPNPRPLDLLFHERGSMIVSVPLIFNETTYIHPLDDLFPDQSPVDPPEFGPFAALAMSYDISILDDGSERVATLAVFASRDFIDVNMLRNPYIGNAHYMLGLFEGLTDHMAGVYIAPKTIGVSPLPVTDFQAIVFGLIFVIALPLAVVFAGGVVYIRRRHL